MVRQTQITDEEIYLPDLLKEYWSPDEQPIIEDLRLVGCTIYGPALIRVENGSTTHCTFAVNTPEDMMWSLPPDRQWLVGVILLRRVDMEFCRIVNIGFVVNDEEQMKIASSLTKLELD
jgi:hypothetical protein